MSDIPPCPWCGKPPKRGLRDGTYHSIGCHGFRTPAWYEWTHHLLVWSWTLEGAESRWRRLVEMLTARRADGEEGKP